MPSEKRIAEKLGKLAEWQATVKGAEWTPETQMIAALVRRLGGHVRLSPFELIDSPDSGLVITAMPDSSLEIKAK